MTTIVVVRKGDTAVIAADSLTTFGTTRLAPAYDRHPQKVMTYGDSFIGVAGSAAHQLVLENLLARSQDLDFHGKGPIYESFRKLHPMLKDDAFLNPKEEEDDPYESTQITALIANGNGIFGVYSMREVFEYTQFWAVGSGREFALGAMQSLFGRLRSATAIAKIASMTNQVRVSVRATPCENEVGVEISFGRSSDKSLAPFPCCPSVYCPPLLDAGTGEPASHGVRCWLLAEPERRTRQP